MSGHLEHVQVPDTDPDPRPEEDPDDFWERRYADSESVWSGQVNATLEAAIGDLEPGRSLDLGCGEGGDVLWMAARGWDALGVDISRTAIARARDRAEQECLDSAHFQVANLGRWDPVPASFNLVTASFFHSPVHLDRYEALRRAAQGLTLGGRLVMLSHAAPPPWSSFHPDDMLSPAEDRAGLALPEAEWEIAVEETRTRAAVDPDGNPADLIDGLLIIRRRG